MIVVSKQSRRDESARIDTKTSMGLDEVNPFDEFKMSQVVGAVVRCINTTREKSGRFLRLESIIVSGTDLGAHVLNKDR